MKLINALVLIAKIAHLALAAPSEPSTPPDITEPDDELSVADLEAVFDETVVALGSQEKSKAKMCRDCHALCVTVSTMPPVVAACLVSCARKGCYPNNSDPDLVPDFVPGGE